MKIKINDQDFAGRMQQLVKIVGNPNKLAKLAGLALPTVNKLLTGTQDPTRTSLIALAKATGTTIEWISTGKGPMYQKDIAGTGISVEHKQGYSAPSPEKIEAIGTGVPGVQKYRDVVDAVVEVLSSDDEGTILALAQNAFTFQKTVRFGQKIGQLENDIEAIKKVLNPGRLESDVKEG